MFVKLSISEDFMALNKISLSTTIKNRLHLFKQALPSWLRHDFKHIYILNWNSDDSRELEEYIRFMDDPRIVMETVKGKRTTYFQAAQSRNIAVDRCMTMCHSEYIFQIDCDIMINDSIRNIWLGDPNVVYFSKCTYYLQDNDAFETNYRKNKNGMLFETLRPLLGTFGTCLMPTYKVRKYGFYDENMIENNLFDCVYLRNYYQQEPENIHFFRDEIGHIDHSNELRTAETPETHNLVRGMLINRILNTAVMNGELQPYRYHYTVGKDGTLWTT